MPIQKLAFADALRGRLRVPGLTWPELPGVHLELRPCDVASELEAPADELRDAIERLEEKNEKARLARQERDRAAVRFHEVFGASLRFLESLEALGAALGWRGGR